MAKYTILLIDYEPRSIERARRPLADVGYRVEIATDGVSGIEAFHRLGPDLVLVEAMIPKKHGFEVCQELKKGPNGSRTPVLITTSVYKGRKYRNQALHLYGCDDYIEKPIADEQLVLTCARHLRDETVAARLAAIQAGAPAAQPPAAPASEPREHALAEREIIARLDAILPDGMLPPGPSAPGGLATTSEPEASIPAPLPAPCAEPERETQHVIEFRERPARKRGKGGHGKAKAAAVHATAEPSAVSLAVSAAPALAVQPVAEPVVVPVTEPVLAAEPVLSPMLDEAGPRGMPWWVVAVAIAIVGTVVLLTVTVL